MMQTADDSVLPNVIEFSVTVAASDTPVYDVTLSAGSVEFAITGTDGISSPTDSSNSTDFTVTDNSLLKWTQAVLGKSPGTVLLQ